MWLHRIEEDSERIHLRMGKNGYDYGKDIKNTILFTKGILYDRV